MKINRDNYEAYFLDYHEGQLSPEMAEEVLLFVELNPDLRSVFDDFEAVSLVTDEEIVFEKKSALKKNHILAINEIDESNYEEYLVAEIEGLLNSDQLISLEEFIRINPHLEKERRLYSFAHLQADSDVVFEAKESLKQKAIAVGPIDTLTYETYFARELEGDLNEEEAQQLAGFMKYNPHLKKERSLYKHTILTADTDIVFENKNQLKQSITPVRRIIYYALSAAASLALIMSVYFLLNRNDDPQNIAQQVKTNTTQHTSKTAFVLPDKQVTVIGNQGNGTVSNSESVSTNATKETQSSGNTIINSNPAVTDASMTLANLHYIEPLTARSAQVVTTRQYVDPQFTFIRKSQMYLNEQLEFYYNLKLAEQIQYAELNSKDANPAKTILNAATGKAEEMFAFKQENPVKEEKKNVSLWTFAELGVQTFNTVTSSELELKLRKDEEGKVVAYGLQGGILDFEKEVKK